MISCSALQIALLSARSHDVAHFAGGYVLGHPAKPIAHAVEKLAVLHAERKADADGFQQVSGVEPGISRCKDIAQDLASSAG
jgi:hypothetical protein